MVAAGAFLAAAPAAIAQPVYAVRNIEPEQTVSAPHETWPIYYPRIAHTPGPAGDDDLARTLLDLHTAMRYEQAGSIAVQIIELDTSRPEGHYNLACVLARLHRTEEAVAALERAVALGWNDRTHMVLDPDLEVIRSDVRFGELLERLETIVAIERRNGGDAPENPVDLTRHDPQAASARPVHNPPAPVIVLVGEQPEFPVLNEPPRPARAETRRLVTLALAPPIARRLRTWLAWRQDRPAGWITTAPADIPVSAEPDAVSSAP